MQRRVIQAFDQMAAGYDAWYETPLGALVYAEEQRALTSFDLPRAGRYALEVGTGTGRFGQLLGEEAVVVGLDPSLKMLQQARMAHGSRAGWALVRGVAEALPFMRAVFDVVLCVTTLEFVPDPRAALDEMYRVVRPGGRLVIGVLNAWSPWAWERRRRAGQGVYAHARFFSPKELQRLLGPYGRLRWKSAVFWPPWFSRPSPGVAWAWERLGALLLKPWGAFLVAVVAKEDKS